MIKIHNRSIPTDIKRQLRQEVGFGCPFCGSPYLTYHHFDPPWREGQNHNPSGMIALCLEHHKKADSGVFTNEQLYDAKKVKADKVFGSVDWRRKNVFFKAGASFIYECPVMIEFSCKKLIWITEDSNGNSLFNIDFEFNGLSIFQMRDNDWTIWSDVDDLLCPPGGRSLKIASESLNFNFSMVFSDINQIEANAIFDGKHFSNDALQCSVQGNLPYKIPIKILKNDMLIGTNGMCGGKFLYCGTAIGIG